MSVAVQTAETRVVLSNIDWPTYQTLRAAVDNRNIRMTYDRGVLELMSPSKLHERLAALLGRLIEGWTEEHKMAIQSCGSTTFQREDLQRGLEPDRCYYVQHEAAVRDRDELDLSVDPPPDLVVEVDITSSSARRMPVYAELAVPELWCWSDEKLRVDRLGADRKYVECAASTCLPGFPIADAAGLLQRRHAQDETSLVSQFRTRVRATR